MKRPIQVGMTPRGKRPGFTLVELMVVIAIIAVLVTITVAAVMQVLTIEKKRATEATIQKITSELDRQMKAVFDTAKTEPIPQNVVTLAGGQSGRARVIWIKMRLKQEFPMSYAEAHNPIPAAVLQPNGPLVLSDLPAKNVFKGLPAAANNAATESSACLLIALTQGRRGVTWDPQQTLGAGFVRDTDGDGVPELVDTWDTALYFVRWPYNNTDLNPSGAQPGVNDSQDPEGLLSNPTWVSSYGNVFAQLCHPVAAGASYKNLNPFVASCGTNQKREDNPPTSGDDLFSYRLRTAGSKGD
jgi:prepilin-type N-terminal cleavage/methylation domain-containing protein